MLGLTSLLQEVLGQNQDHTFQLIRTERDRARPIAQRQDIRRAVYGANDRSWSDLGELEQPVHELRASTGTVFLILLQETKDSRSLGRSDGTGTGIELDGPLHRGSSISSDLDIVRERHGGTTLDLFSAGQFFGMER